MRWRGSHRWPHYGHGLFDEEPCDLNNTAAATELRGWQGAGTEDARKVKVVLGRIRSDGPDTHVRCRDDRRVFIYPDAAEADVPISGRSSNRSWRESMACARTAFMDEPSLHRRLVDLGPTPHEGDRIRRCTAHDVGRRGLRVAPTDALSLYRQLAV